VPANLAHHFLLGLTTKPGFGVCFKDRGWYLRSEEASDGNSGDKTDGKSKGSKIHNKILSNIVKTLKVNEDARQQELALRIFGACPELVAG
jgi:nucleolar pre-ribosomal-associated protein 1